MTTGTMAPTTTPTRERTASDVLRAAARYIEEWDWCQGEYADTRGRVCVLGALNSVTTGVYDTHDMDGIGFVAERALEAFFGKSVATYNDTPGRTRDEVLAALRAAAESQP